MGLNNPHVNDHNPTVAQGALEGDYKKKYKKTRDKMLDRPGKGSHELLKLRYAKKKSKTKTG